MSDRLSGLLDALRAERARPLAHRETGASDDALDGAVERVSRARYRLAAGDRDEAARLLAEVARQVADTWSYTAPLSTDVVGCAQDLRRG